MLKNVENKLKSSLFLSTFPFSQMRTALVWRISNLQSKHHLFAFPSMTNYLNGVSLRRSQKYACNSYRLRSHNEGCILISLIKASGIIRGSDIFILTKRKNAGG